MAISAYADDEAGHGVLIQLSPTSTGSKAVISDHNAYQIAHVDLSDEQQKAFDQLKILLGNKSLPLKDAYCACENFFTSLEHETPGLGQLDYQQIDYLLLKNQDASVASFIKGCFNIKLAWSWRGSAHADKLQKMQIEMFEEKLSFAEKAIDEAWSQNPKEPLIANEMLNVKLGQGKEPEMELWFQRAMALETNNYFACRAKLTFLEPKWYGSTDRMIAFGRQCYASTIWGGKVPLIIANAHEIIAKDYLPVLNRDTYWKRADVWADISSAYEKYFTAYPKDSKEHQNYAHFAYLGEQWSVLNSQLTLMGAPDYTIFGGKIAFDKMIQSNRQHVIHP